MDKVRTCKRLLSILLACALAPMMLPTTAFATESGSASQQIESEEASEMSAVATAASTLGGTVERIADTESWYSDATKAFDTRDTYWNDQVTTAPAGYAVVGQTVSIGTPEALVWWAKQVNEGVSFAGYTVNITEDLNLSAHYWTPICTGTVSYTADGEYSIANNKTLDGTTIDGNGHTITGLATQTGLRGPNQDSKPGDGSNCYYDAAFIGYSCCNITIEGLTFDGARIAISEPFNEVVNTYGSSMLAVVVGAQVGGSLTLNNVTVNDADVLAMQKASAFVGNLMGGSTLTVSQCAITNSRFSAYFQVAPIAAYGTAEQVTVNGIKLQNNTVRMVDQTWPEGYLQDSNSGAWYIDEGKGYVLNASSTTVFYGSAGSIGNTNVTGSEWAPAAEVNGYQYDTLAAAVAAVPDGVETSVKLTADCRLDDTVTIPEGKIVVLDLNGKTVTEAGAGDRKICNKGQLTVLSSAAGGTLKNEDAGSYGLIDNYGTLKIQSGNFENYGRASGAAIKNRPSAALLEISGGVFEGLVEDPDGNQNGYATSANVLVASEAPLVVTGGTFSSRAHYSAVFKIFSDNADIRNATVSTYMAGGIEVAGGKAVLTDCEFHVSAENSYYANAVAVSNGGTATIDGGTYTGYKYATYVYNSGGTINISGGKFDAEIVLKADKSTTSDLSVINVAGGAFTGNLEIHNDATLSVTGGYFTSNPSAYVAADQDLAAVEGSYVQDGVSYSYQVTTAPLDNVEVKPGATEVSVPSADELGITDEQQVALDTAISGITGSGLSSAGNSVASDGEKLPDTNQALEDFKSKLPEESLANSATEVTVVVSPRLDVTVETYNPEQNKLTLDIKAVYDLKATTATDSEDMKEVGDEGVESRDVNTVTLEKNAGTLDTTGTQVQITVPLPAGFVSSADESVFVTHVKDSGDKYVYKATVSGNAGTGFIASFLNANGFSSFTLTKDIAASITDGSTTTYYETLQEAVNAAANGQTIKLEKDSAENVVVNSVVSFTLDKNDNNFTGSIAAASGYTMSENNGVYTFTFTGGTGGGGAAAAEEYEVTVAPTAHGAVAAEPAKAAEGDTVTLTVLPDEGYELTHLSVLDADKAEVELAQNADGTYSFEMPASEVAVYAVFSCDGGELCPSHGFADVDQSQWYHEAIDWAVANKVLNGFDDTGLMVPDGEVTRAQMAQILWNVEGRPAVDYAAGFGDVAEGDWFYQAVAWAASEGIFKGYDDGSGLFGPNDVLTREQAAAVLMRWTEANGGDVSARADLSDYPDVDGVSAWAAESGCVSWAVAAGVISGVEQEDGSLLLDPTGTATRAQTAMLMMRLTAE